MIFASFYTKNGRYPELAKRLKTSLQKFDLPCRIEERPDAGEWNRTCGGKAQFILELLCRYRRPVIWLDCDTQVVQLPSLLFQSRHDFAAYNWLADAGNVGQYPYDPQKLAVSGGVLCFGYSAAAIELLLRWIERMEKGDLQDDPSLDAVFNFARPPVNPLWLPRSYNRMDTLFPETRPVIDHEYQRGGHRNEPEETR